MKVVILAGGRGARMGTLTKDVPKPMVELAEKPILEHQIELANRYGLLEIFLLTGYKSEVIEAHFGDGTRWGVDIRYSCEKMPLGTAGAVKALEGRLDGDFLVFYGDVMMDVDLKSLLQFHLDKGATATIVVHPNDHPYDSDLVGIDASSRVVAFHSKPHPPGVYLGNLVNAALYVLSPAALRFVPNGTPSDFGKDVFPALLASGEAIYAYNTPEYIKDVGTAERLVEVEADTRSGRVGRFNRVNCRGAVFLDRDGVLNHNVEPVTTADGLTLFPGASRAIRNINKSDRLAVVATNQPAIAKGFMSIRDLKDVHTKLEALLGADRAYVDRIYYCPHHPERGIEGENEQYKVECDCRKPKTGLIERAVFELNIDIADSFMIGDRTVDIMTGINAGLTTILVRTGCAGNDGKYPCEPDFVCSGLEEAIGFVNDRYAALMNRANALLEGDILTGRSRALVLVGGLSRSGKSTLAAALSLALRRRGTAAKRLELEHWLIGLDRRPPGMTVRGRYRYDDIVPAVERLLRGDEIDFARYDVLARQPGVQHETLSLNEGEVLIVDGVVSLDMPTLREAAALRLYTEAPEDVRKVRFDEFYLYKGLGEEARERLYHERQNDETPIVIASRQHADCVVDLEAL